MSLGQALRICGWSPVVSQGSTNVQPWAGSQNKSSPPSLPPSQPGGGKRPRWREKTPVTLGQCGREKRCLQETGLRKRSSGKAEEIRSRLPWLSKFAQTVFFLLNGRKLPHSFNCLGVKKETDTNKSVSNAFWKEEGYQ